MTRLIPVVLLACLLGALSLLALSFPPKQFYPVTQVRLAGGGTAELIGQPVGNRALCEAQRSALVTWLQGAAPGTRTAPGACRPSPAPDLAHKLSAQALDTSSLRTTAGVLVFSTSSEAEALWQALVAQGRAEAVQFHAAGTRRAGIARDPLPFPLPRICFLMAVGGGLLLIALMTGLMWQGRGGALVRPERHRRRHAALALTAGDLLVLVVALTLVTFARESWYAPISDQEVTLAPASAAVHALLSLIALIWLGPVLQHYARRRPFWDEFAETTRVLFTVFLLACTFSFLFRLDSARGTLLLVWAAAVLLIPVMRRCVREQLNAAGLWMRPAVIIGLGDNAVEAARAIASEGNLGYDVRGFLPSGLPGEHTPRSAGALPHPLLDCPDATPGAVAAAIERLDGPEVVVAVESLSSAEAATLVQTLSMRFSGLHIIPTIRGLPLFGTTLSHFFRHEVLFLTLRNTLHHRGLQLVKRSFDLAGALLLIVLLSPALLVICALILRSGGTPFYVHRRVGRGGRHFGCLKFRSMRTDAEQVLRDLLARDPAARAEWERDFKLKDDPRITRIGQLLRRTSLDELPQLWNVVRGEMSLVGPRPIIDAELPRYGEQADLYLEVRPGITGLWQVSGRNDTDYNERVALDTWYVQNWSLWYDIIILFQTVDTVLTRRGAY